ncbi:YafY family transcriptional regulator [Jannaschia sp. S6380]|uniref:helix-turn-helix transcriptional regulator n=1 Tax=Jannaschia sp. S6380 TaxID=2926408 RepID=UPI001FF53541|nr:YafY family protein [Jannaschia sp. S6380]MCK0166845.1 YafY family transcriptional regulator [Jannaschia sp. S6380]
MRRADRLFRLVQILRDGRLRTAARLAEEMEVSERTIYRDIADLMASGVPIEGAAGVGYVMRSGYDLPPLMFTEAEITALALGARMAVAWGGPAMAAGARDALAKIEAVVPRREELRAALDRLGAPSMGQSAELRERLDRVDALIRDRRVLLLDYADEVGRQTERRVQPLALWFWGRAWTLVAWCELRGDFRMFRIDRIRDLTPKEQFTPAPACGLPVLLARLAEEEGCALAPDIFNR